MLRKVSECKLDLLSTEVVNKNNVINLLPFICLVIKTFLLGEYDTLNNSVKILLIHIRKVRRSARFKLALVSWCLIMMALKGYSKISKYTAISFNPVSFVEYIIKNK